MHAQGPLHLGRIELEVLTGPIRLQSRNRFGRCRLGLRFVNLNVDFAAIDVDVVERSATQKDADWIEARDIPRASRLVIALRPFCAANFSVAAERKTGPTDGPQITARKIQTFAGLLLELGAKFRPST
ncbi:MAG: hypothetical protein M3Q89_00200 [Verrucomicrobiota bacterium]|nr:hypothetical protein [Verrucomicrobiota bacterium]